MGRVMAFTK